MARGVWVVVALSLVGCSTVAPNRRLDARLPTEASTYGASRGTEPLNARLAAKLTGRSAGLLRHEPRLESVAAAVGELTSKNGVLPANAVLQWLVWRAGVIGAPLHTRVRTFTGPLEPQVDAELTTWADELSRETARPVAFALARFDGAPGGLALVTADDEVSLEPVKRAVAAGERLELRGAVTATGEELEVLIEDDDSHVRAEEVPVDANGGFSVKVAAPAKSGVRFVELVRRLPDGETRVSHRRPIALFPLAVDVAFPSEPPSWVQAPKADPPRRDQWSEQLMAAYAEQRAALGLSVPATDARLEPLAARLAGIRGVSGMQGDENLAELLLSQGLVSREAWARFSTADTLDELVHETLQRPSWRRVFLSEAPVAVAPVLSQHEGRVLAWEVVAVLMPKLDAVVEATRLRDALMKRREGLTRSTAVEAVLQPVVDAACRDDADEVDLRAVAKTLQEQGVRGKLMGNAVQRASVNDGVLPDEFVDLLTTGYPRIAVATCQADGPGLQWSAVLVGEFD